MVESAREHVNWPGTEHDSLKQLGSSTRLGKVSVRSNIHGRCLEFPRDVAYFSFANGFTSGAHK